MGSVVEQQEGPQQPLPPAFTALAMSPYFFCTASWICWATWIWSAGKGRGGRPRVAAASGPTQTPLRWPAAAGPANRPRIAAASYGTGERCPERRVSGIVVDLTWRISV